MKTLPPDAKNIEESRKKINFPIVWGILFCLVVLCAAFLSIPNFISSGKSNFTSIVGRLREIDGAKQLWAVEHHQTNDVTISEQDIAPYLMPSSVVGGCIKTIAGERYRINSLWKSPDAELIQELGSRPKGTIIHLDEFISPDGVLKSSS